MTLSNPKQAKAYAIEWNQPLQYLYKIGLLVRAFALLHARTSQLKYLQLAESFYRRAVESPNVWHNTLAHKLGWAAYTLGILTRKPEYTDGACRVADRLVSLQQPDGGFHYPEFWPSYEKVELEWKCNMYAQFSTWIAYARSLLWLDRGHR